MINIREHKNEIESKLRFGKSCYENKIFNVEELKELIVKMELREVYTYEFISIEQLFHYLEKISYKVIEHIEYIFDDENFNNNEIKKYQIKKIN